MNDPQGPILDWIKQLLAGLADLLRALCAQIGTMVGHLHDRIDGVEARLEWAFWLLLGMLALHALVGAWSRRK